MGITTGERYIGFQVFIPQLPDAGQALLTQFCYLAGLGFTQNWLMGITTGERYTGFQVFISRLSPPVLLPRRARFYAKLVNWVSPLAKGALVFQVFIPQLPGAGQALLTQFCMRVCNANSVAILEELRTLLPKLAQGNKVPSI
ncbi:MAG: hypothetical protein HDR51_07940 [Treponema sp.]|nr:hypothetical protein [Treponema sp.]